MKKSLIMFFGIILIMFACEHRAVDPQILSRPTQHDRHGINRADPIPNNDNKNNNKNAGAKSSANDSSRRIINEYK